MIDYSKPPRHTFLTATEVMDRCGWRRTKGYKLTASDDFPRDIAGRYRLDTVLAWEDSQLSAEAQPRAIDTDEPGDTFHPMIENAEPRARHTFLTRTEVMARYRWKRTKGYKLIASDDFPPAIVGRYRLDTLMAWEDSELATPVPGSTAGAAGPIATRTTTETVTLPPRRRTRGVSRTAAA